MYKVYVKYKTDCSTRCRSYHTHAMEYDDACEIARIFRRQPNVLYVEVVGNYR